MNKLAYPKGNDAEAATAQCFVFSVWKPLLLLAFLVADIMVKFCWILGEAQCL